MINKTKHLIALSMLLVSSATPAAQLLFDLYASDTVGGIAPSPPTDWVAGTPVPSMVHISFLLDTLSASTATYISTPDIHNSSQSCLSHFDAGGLAISNLSVQTDQGALWSASNLSNGDIGGDNAGGGCPGFFFAGLRFGEGGNSFIWAFNIGPGPSQADIESSTDPLATILIGFSQPYSVGNLALTGGWGTLYIGPIATVTAVPLPSTITLFASGLFSLAWKAHRRDVTKATA